MKKLIAAIIGFIAMGIVVVVLFVLWLLDFPFIR